jgi:hypothetical protein
LPAQLSLSCVLCVPPFQAANAPSHRLNSIRVGALTWQPLGSPVSRLPKKSPPSILSNGSVSSRPPSSHWTAISASVALRSVDASSHRLNSIRSRCSHPAASRLRGVATSEEVATGHSLESLGVELPAQLSLSCVLCVPPFQAENAPSHRLNSIRDDARTRLPLGSLVFESPARLSPCCAPRLSPLGSRRLVGITDR